MVQLDADAPCCDQMFNSPPCATALTLPVGGGLGLLLSLYAYTFWYVDGLDDFATAAEDLGVKNMDQLTILLDQGVYLFILANVFVVAYGFREKCRIRNDMCHHISCCGIPCCLKFLVKGVVQLVVCGSVLMVLFLAVILEAMYVIFLTIDQVCKSASSTLESLEPIFELMGSDGGTDALQEKCDIVGAGMDGTYKVLLGSLMLVISQIIVLAYWYKYSTLAMVSPFYTTGKWAAGDEQSNPVNKEVEMMEAQKPAKGGDFQPKKAPRKL